MPAKQEDPAICRLYLSAQDALGTRMLDETIGTDTAVDGQVTTSAQQLRLLAVHVVMRALEPLTADQNLSISDWFGQSCVRIEGFKHTLVLMYAIRDDYFEEVFAAVDQLREGRPSE